ncbi:ROK family protein [Streptomyces sp. 3MP-14]|uniref:ROK family protein n=1 Tax=Streptomyces mimosae TaxID=2586635 RepID=A0A5N5ZN37_9ACTN|nr:ROK family protein [Streptomyces mimosae]KAB8172412.1 ROK family protein [Streptomyces sp. 3MP-14]
MGGRPPVPVLDIGGTHVTAALVEPAAARVAARLRAPLDGRGTAGEIFGAVADCAAALARRAPVPAGARWGVAIPGPFDYARGVGEFADVGKFDSLRGVDVGRALTGALPGPPGRVAFVNDAHAFLIGEWHAGAARRHRRCVGITLGTGVGSAFLADGTPVTSGPTVPPGGRADLLTIDGRPLEETVSRRALLARYGEPELDVRAVAERARAGEERAGRLLVEAFGALGRALAPWLTAFEATGLVVGGSMVGSWDLLGPALRAGLGPVAPVVTITTSERDADAPLLGAALVAGGD